MSTHTTQYKVDLIEVFVSTRRRVQEQIDKIIACTQRMENTRFIGGDITPINMELALLELELQELAVECCKQARKIR